MTSNHTDADTDAAHVAECRAYVIAALVRTEGISEEAAARALDEGHARVKVDGREYTISSDGAVVTPTVLPWAGRTGGWGMITTGGAAGH